MTTKSLILVTIVSGCATTERMSSWSGRDHHTGATVALHPERAASDEAQAWFPALASDAALPTADRVRDQLLATGRERFDLGVRICVAPDGSVSRVDLAQSSGEQVLDNIALHDIKGWHYDSFAGPAGLQTCEPLSIRYMP